MEIYAKISVISTVSPFLIFIHDLIITVISLVSHLHTKQLVTWVTYRVFNTNLWYSCANFRLGIDAKYGLAYGFNTILWWFL